MANNEMQWSKAKPGLLIIMIDQSGSMLKPYDGEDNRSQFTAKAVNRVINQIIQSNFNGKEPNNRCFIRVIGYDAEVKDLVSGYLQKLYAIARIDTIAQKISDGAGGLVEVLANVPAWVDPIKYDKWTNMTAAFKMAKATIEKWIEDKPDHPAPVIINISDGRPYYDNKEISECVKETKAVVDDIKRINTSDGKVQIFNVMLGEGRKIEFPTPNDKLESEEAQFLYDISTEIPDAYRSVAEKHNIKLENNARGAIYNADAVSLVRLINFGSSKGKN